MLENRVQAPRGAARAALARIRSPLTPATLALIRVRHRHAMRHATTCGEIMNDAVLVCLRKMSARAYASGAKAFL